MVEEGLVEEADRTGNNAADEAADKGITDAHEDTAAMAKVFEQRQSRYIDFMDKFHKLIVFVMKNRKELRENM